MKSTPPKEREAAPLVIQLMDQNLSTKEIIARTGLHHRTINEIVREEKVRRCAEPEITPEMLSMTAQKKLETAIKQHQAKLEREFNAKLQAAVRRYLDITSNELRKEQDEAKRVMESRKGIMDRASYKKILACLHPDWVTDPTQKARYEAAFREFTQLEKLLLSEKDSPSTFIGIPKTAAEWEELKRKATAARKAKRKTVAHP